MRAWYVRIGGAGTSSDSGPYVRARPEREVRNFAWEVCRFAREVCRFASEVHEFKRKVLRPQA